MPPMQKMAAPLALVSALCHVATIALIGNMRIQSSTLWATPAGPPRSLLDSSDGDALVSLRARLESMRDEMEEMHVDKRRSDERVEQMSSRVDMLAEELRATRKGERTQWPEAEAEQGLINTTHRQMQQGAASSCDASGVCTARIIARTVVMQSAMSSGGGAPQRGRRAQAAPCDFAAESAAVMDVCCATAGGGHRRAQADCPLPEVCPSTRCAEVFQAFYSSCSAELEGSAELRAGLAVLSASCNELVGASSLAHQLNLQCTDTSLTAEDCVPPCNAEYHGYMLLLNIDGDDSKFSCNLAHGLYSWMGASSEGGYLGGDAQSFFSAVVSGAAGTYMCELTEGAGITTDLSVQRGQIVSISGRSGETTWGSGSFELSDGASLILINMVITSQITVAAGAALTLDTVTVQPDACVSTEGSAHLTLLNTVAPEQCLINVQWDGSDPSAFLSNLGSGRSGTYVLRVTGDSLVITAVSIRPQQDVRFISAGGGSTVIFSEDVTVAPGASFSVSGGIETVAFQGAMSVGRGGSISLFVTSSTITFERSVELGVESNLSIGGSIAALAFPAGLRAGSGATVSIRSGSQNSIAVAMGTTWYAVDPSSNHGSVTFGAVGLLSTDGETLIGTVEGTLPGSLSVELNGKQPGGGGPQSGAVLLAEDGVITIPPQVSAAVGQVFTDDRIADFVSTVNAGTPGMYGLQLRTDRHANEVDGLSVSGGQDVRIFSSATESSLAFKHELRVEPGGALAVTGTISPLAFTGGLAVSDGAALAISGGVALSVCDATIAIGSDADFGTGVSVIASDGGDTAIITESSTMPGTMTATLDGHALGSLSRDNDGARLFGTGIFTIQMADLIEWTAAGDAGALQLCLADDAPAAVGTTERCRQCSPTVRVPCDENADCGQDGSRMPANHPRPIPQHQLTLQCSKPGGAGSLCAVRDRLALHGDERNQQPDETTLIRLRFANLNGYQANSGGAIRLTGSGLLFVFGCAFEHNSVAGGSSVHGGAIDVSANHMNPMLVVYACSFVDNTAPGNGGHGSAIAITGNGGAEITLVVSASSFSGNTCSQRGCDGSSIAVSGSNAYYQSRYTDGEASQGINEPEAGTCLCQASSCVCG